ncbi:branched-chain amino acid ABC transporter permease [Porphyromonas loveana]|uniref:Amino acid/amide ABC transporter membrane protein 2 (HAAT family) n=1 Tax=Porphyromonas loveana TaxID=1884669 RepID=A0A2U1FKV7_9PORP|nr:branched-chain amino acid ABC transporter permease [Porphyromonas loveana]PVZ12808.1 amino acid/amide ABC transporter membrane protein 2 (HAAT family) [Porphyromonas loveana]
MEYILHLLILICIYTILAQSLSLVAGYSGQVSLAHAGFYGIGAYTTALLSVHFGTPPLLNMLAALLLSGIIAYIVSKVAVKTVDDYYIIITLGIQVVMFSIMNNWQSVTNGPLGIPGIPAFSIFGLPIESKLSFLLLSAFFAGAVWWLLSNITRSPFGRVLRALSEDEIYTQSLGKNVAEAKVVSFVISGMLASIAGVLYAHYISYIDPTSFTVDESIFIMSIVIIGGMRHLKGIFYAAAFLVLLPEALRFVGMPSAIAANMRQIFYGIALILVVYRGGNLVSLGTARKATQQEQN